MATPRRGRPPGGRRRARPPRPDPPRLAGIRRAVGRPAPAGAARAGLARGADLLLLDEPTTGLDAASAARIRAIMRAEADRGIAVVAVSHDPAVLAEADRVVRLEDGRVIGDEAR
ncbi:ABC transporter ATP-binding protein [Clavibacter tessellarius]|uniref:ATP-binding cassette domain-containing protein n=1 Tax=Clavibacter tessellarius TaxID=31965 RepID=UPI0039BFFFF1